MRDGGGEELEGGGGGSVLELPGHRFSSVGKEKDWGGGELDLFADLSSDVCCREHQVLHL